MVGISDKSFPFLNALSKIVFSDKSLSHEDRFVQGSRYIAFFRLDVSTTMPWKRKSTILRFLTSLKEAKER
jgi:hypothetical protein